jgi:hypothetical protein
MSVTCHMLQKMGRIPVLTKAQADSGCRFSTLSNFTNANGGLVFPSSYLENHSPRRQKSARLGVGLGRVFADRHDEGDALHPGYALTSHRARFAILVFHLFQQIRPLPFQLPTQFILGRQH